MSTEPTEAKKGPEWAHGFFIALRLLVVGGSLGAKALNDVVPRALALIPESQRPQVLHQSGARQIDALQDNYRRAGVDGLEHRHRLGDPAGGVGAVDACAARPT